MQKSLTFVFTMQILFALGAGASVYAQDPVKVAPEVYKVGLENERVRILDVQIKAGGKSASHSHPAYVAVALSPCKVKFTAPDGKTSEADMKAGDAIWSEPTTHGTENVGSGDCNVRVIELKESGGKGK